MPNFTRRAIKESFLKLLNQRPLNQITVKDIVEDCGINRNSFYYHFSDLPALVEEYNTVHHTDWKPKASIKDYTRTPSDLQRLLLILDSFYGTDLSSM